METAGNEDFVILQSVGVIAHLTFALGHMSPEELPAERKQSQKAFNVSEANHESELFIQKCLSLSSHSRDIMYSRMHAHMAQLEADLQRSTELLLMI